MSGSGTEFREPRDAGGKTVRLSANLTVAWATKIGEYTRPKGRRIRRNLRHGHRRGASLLSPALGYGKAFPGA